MTVRDYVAAYILPTATTGTTGTIGYLAQHDLLSQIPVLQRDITIPDYTALVLDVDSHCDDTVLSNIWFGPINTQSPLHYDCYYNLLTQIVGFKYLRLYAPQYSAQLAPLPGRMCNNSTVDLLAEDVYTSHPQLVETPYWECVLSPGDMLFLPRHWWHFVQSLDTATALAVGTGTTALDGAQQTVQFSFSVNFWWGDSIPAQT